MRRIYKECWVPSMKSVSLYWESIMLIFVDMLQILGIFWCIVSPYLPYSWNMGFFWITVFNLDVLNLVYRPVELFKYRMEWSLNETQRLIYMICWLLLVPICLFCSFYISFTHLKRKGGMTDAEIFGRLRRYFFLIVYILSTPYLMGVLPLGICQDRSVNFCKSSIPGIIFFVIALLIVLFTLVFMCRSIFLSIAPFLDSVSNASETKWRRYFYIVKGIFTPDKVERHARENWLRWRELQTACNVSNLYFRQDLWILAPFRLNKGRAFNRIWMMVLKMVFVILYAATRDETPSERMIRQESEMAIESALNAGSTPPSSPNLPKDTGTAMIISCLCLSILMMCVNSFIAPPYRLRSLSILSVLSFLPAIVLLAVSVAVRTVQMNGSGSSLSPLVVDSSVLALLIAFGSAALIAILVTLAVMILSLRQFNSSLNLRMLITLPPSTVLAAFKKDFLDGDGEWPVRKSLTFETLEVTLEQPYNDLNNVESKLIHKKNINSQINGLSFEQKKQSSNSEHYQYNDYKISIIDVLPPLARIRYALHRAQFIRRLHDEMASLPIPSGITPLVIGATPNPATLPISQIQLLMDEISYLLTILSTESPNEDNNNTHNQYKNIKKDLLALNAKSRRYSGSSFASPFIRGKNLMPRVEHPSPGSDLAILPLNANNHEGGDDATFLSPRSIVISPRESVTVGNQSIKGNNSDNKHDKSQMAFFSANKNKGLVDYYRRRQYIISKKLPSAVIDQLNEMNSIVEWLLTDLRDDLNILLVKGLDAGSAFYGHHYFDSIESLATTSFILDKLNTIKLSMSAAVERKFEIPFQSPTRFGYNRNNTGHIANLTSDFGITKEEKRSLWGRDSVPIGMRRRIMQKSGSSSSSHVLGVAWGDYLSSLGTLLARRRFAHSLLAVKTGSKNGAKRWKQVLLLKLLAVAAFKSLLKDLRAQQVQHEAFRLGEKTNKTWGGGGHHPIVEGSASDNKELNYLSVVLPSAVRAPGGRDFGAFEVGLTSRKAF